MHPFIQLMLGEPQTFRLPISAFRPEIDPFDMQTLQKSISQAGLIHFGLANPGAFGSLESYFIGRPDRFAAGMTRLLGLIIENRELLTESVFSQIRAMPAPSKKVINQALGAYAAIWARDATSTMVKAATKPYKTVVFETLDDVFVAFDSAVDAANEAARLAQEAVISKRSSVKRSESAPAA